jgi:hypothetical protein
MEFSEVSLSYSLFTKTNKITEITNKIKIAYIVRNNTIMDENKTFFEYYTVNKGIYHSTVTA